MSGSGVMNGTGHNLTTYAEISPSGGRLKLFFLYATAELPKLPSGETIIKTFDIRSTRRKVRQPRAPMSDTHNSAPLLLTEEEAAAKTVMAKGSLQRLRLDGEVPAYVQHTDSRVGYREPALPAWMQTRIVDLTPPLKAGGATVPPGSDRRDGRPPVDSGPRAPPPI
jgi:hypothetical protein